MALTKGWLYLDYGGAKQMQIQCQWEWDWDFPGATFTDLPAKGHFAFDTKIYKRIIKVKKAMFNNKTDFDLFLANVESLQITPYDCRIKVHSTGLWATFDGVKTTIPVLLIKINGVSTALGDVDHWEIALLHFRQGGALKT